MTDTIHIEPNKAHRPAFALWGLAQDPPLQTATASGWDVPLALYPDVPPGLLEGAYVDGYVHDGPGVAQPMQQAAEGAVEGVEGALVKVPDGGPRTQEARRRRARKTPITTESGYTAAELLGGDS